MKNRFSTKCLLATTLVVFSALPVLCGEINTKGFSGKIFGMILIFIGMPYIPIPIFIVSFFVAKIVFDEPEAKEPIMMSLLVATAVTLVATFLAVSVIW